MRVRRKPWAEEELQTNTMIVKESSRYRGQWKSVFGNDNPIYIEIGCGKGKFITDTAIANTDINFIGIEHQISIVAYAARNLLEHNIQNVRFIYGDAKLLQEYFETQEIRRIYINFCDPWPKRRWVKRRLTYRQFLKIYEDLMGEGGEIHFKTDNASLFEFSLNEFAYMDWKLKNITFDLHNSGFTGNIMTEYEKKFSDRGMPIYRCESVVRKI